MILRRIFICLFVLAGSLRLQAQCPNYEPVIVAGYESSFVIRSDGRLFGWGQNTEGRLGDGTYGRKNYPEQIGIATDWSKVSPGWQHTAALKKDGSLWAWGSNFLGQLGDGTNVNKNYPVQVGNATDWRHLEAGEYHTLGIKQDLSLWGWGMNEQGQLGDGTNVNKNYPVRIGTNEWRSVSGGGRHTVAIKSDGSLWAWGSNNWGQLGDGTNVDKNYPVQIGTGTNWVSISAEGYSTFGIKSDGSLWGWGANYSGQLGDSSYVDKNYPVRIGGADAWESVCTGIYHTLGVKSDGSLWAWGTNYGGQLGDSTNVDKNYPVQIGSAIDWVSGSVGMSSSYGIKSDGSLWAWGSAENGMLGDSPFFNRNHPVQMGAFPVVDRPIATLPLCRGFSRRGAQKIFNDQCSLIVGVKRGLGFSGNIPLAAYVWLDTVQPAQYVKRHYQITPRGGTNPDGVTSRITLYFTQAEFDSFNAVNTKALPTSPGDTQGIANLRIEKRGGETNDWTGLPASYSGAVVTIDPEDNDIVWNAAGGYWKVSFAVTGFSGFFAKTTENVLPVRLLSFKVRETESNALLQWQTAQEVNASHFEIERSTDGKQFEKIGSVSAAGSSSGLRDYTFTDVKYGEIPGQYYYRLRMVDADGSFALSRIESLRRASVVKNVYPNPLAKGEAVTVQASEGIREVYVLDGSARKVFVPVKIKGSKAVLATDKLMPGLYLLLISTDSETIRRKLMVE